MLTVRIECGSAPPNFQWILTFAHQNKSLLKNDSRQFLKPANFWYSVSVSLCFLSVSLYLSQTRYIFIYFSAKTPLCSILSCRTFTKTRKKKFIIINDSNFDTSRVVWIYNLKNRNALMPATTNRMVTQQIAIEYSQCAVWAVWTQMKCSLSQIHTSKTCIWRSPNNVWQPLENLFRKLSKRKLKTIFSI